MTEQSAAENLSLSLKIYKQKQLMRELDLVGFMAPSENKFYATFGKSVGVDFTLQHESISRVHALFQLAKDGALYLFDVSTHGTLLNGKQIPLRKYVELKRGDQIRFGHSSRVYVVERGEQMQSKVSAVSGAQAEEEQRKVREMQQRIEELTKERDCAKEAEQSRAKQVRTLMEQMESLKVGSERGQNGKKEKETMEEEKEKARRVTKVQGIDFV